MVGFCEEEVKLFGPVQEYVAPATVLAVKLSVCPEQMVLLFPAVGTAGGKFITTEVVPIGPVHPLTVTATEYVPALAVVALPITGSSDASEKLFGPVHAYVAPEMVFAVKLSAVPTQTGVLLPTEGAPGV
jgi:hypothetical protein